MTHRIIITRLLKYWVLLLSPLVILLVIRAVWRKSPDTADVAWFTRHFLPIPLALLGAYAGYREDPNTPGQPNASPRSLPIFGYKLARNYALFSALTTYLAIYISTVRYDSITTGLAQFDSILTVILSFNAAILAYIMAKDSA